MSAKRFLLSIGILVWSGAGHAQEIMGFDVTRSIAGPLAGTVGTHGYFEQMNAFKNPAMLSMQDTNGMLSLGAGILYGALSSNDQIAYTYMEKPASGGVAGIGILGVFTHTENFALYDLDGSKIGKVSPLGMLGKLVLAYQIDKYTFGAGVGGAYDNVGWSLDGANGSVGTGGSSSGTTAVLVDAGTRVELGNFNVGGALGVQTGRDAQNRISPSNSYLTMLLGGAYNFDREFKGALDMEYERTFDNGDGLAMPPPRLLFGALWDATRMLDLGLGFTVSEPMSASFGLAVRLAGLKFTYSADMPMEAGPGLAHHIGLAWAFGGRRKVGEAAETSEPVQEIIAPGSVETGGKPTIAIADLEPQNVAAGDSAVITDMFRTELVKQRTFSVIEKSNMEKVLTEQSFQQTGCTSSECAVKIGKILNVRYLIVGSFGKLMGQYIITFRMVDVETANVVYSDSSKNLSNQNQVTSSISEMAARLGKAIRVKK